MVLLSAIRLVSLLVVFSRSKVVIMMRLLLLLLICPLYTQLNVKNVFLNIELCEDVYMRPPLRYSAPEGLVCHLCRSLYGLKQAPHAWFQRFAFVVTAGGFFASAHDPAFFVHVSPRGRTLLLYVDDMIITGDDPGYIVFVKTHLSDQFFMSDLGLLWYFLRIEISTPEGYLLSSHCRESCLPWYH
jgi:hypothetical protein